MGIDLKQKLVFKYLDYLFQNIKIYKKKEKDINYAFKGVVKHLTIFKATKELILFDAREYFLMRDMFDLTSQELQEYVTLYFARKIDSKLIYAELLYGDTGD